MKKTDIEYYKSAASKLMKEFKTLSEYEAIRLIQEEARNETLHNLYQDFRRAYVITEAEPTIPALEKIAILLEDRLPVI
ncbi:hypothetical protein [Spirosoma luteum]|uniref:hypothetical protein n=1 Tax=Spirosoma luteum TaxID=431553 RepID=UPI0003600358|nr:hypothetical protein [Spirosoma luteum]